LLISKALLVSNGYFSEGISFKIKYALPIFGAQSSRIGSGKNGGERTHDFRPKQTI
jgi:hypothetical protein